MELQETTNPKNKILNLVSREVKPPVISIFIPTSRVWEENEKSRIHLKNVFNKVEDYLVQGGLSATKIKNLLEPLYEIQEDNFYWKDQKEGLVLFRSEDYLEEFKLSVDVEPQFYVSDTPNIKPLIYYLFNGMKYYVLALSYFNTRLFKGINREWEELEPTVMPEDIEETFRTHDIQKHIQTHSAGPSGSSKGRPLMRQHGHGERKSTLNEQQKIYLDEIDWALNHFITDIEDEKKPLVILACAESIYDAFNEYSKYPNLCEDYIKGNPKDKDAKELLTEGWSLVKKRIKKQHDSLVETFKQHRGSEKTVEDFEKVIKAVFENRVDVLFVNPHTALWGNYFVEKQKVEISPERDFNNQDLINYAIVNTFLAGGRILPVDSEDFITEHGLAAILRF